MASSIAIELSFCWNGLMLTGGLHLPSGNPPHPAILMLQGSGPADRDNDTYFPRIRGAFLERGLAVYSFDKPGTGDSEGDWRDYALESRAGQALGALAVLRERPEIDAGRVGIFGHSQGGWLVQMLAARLPDLAFAISNSGPSIDVERQNLYGCEHTMREAGHSEAEIAQALTFLHEIHDAARAGEEFESLERRLLAAARSEPWYGYLALEDERDWELARLFTVEAYDPLDALPSIACPFLALFGALDPLVPAWRGARECGEALHRGGNRDATIVVFAGGDHRMQDPDGELAPGYLDLLGSWAAKRAGLS